MNHSHPEPSAAISVWLVDDNQGLRRAVKKLLGLCAGVRCTAEFHSPNSVLSALASRPGPDAILLDIQMGEANGLEAIRPIKALSRHTQIVMFSTCIDLESRQRALSNGATDFLPKSAPYEKIINTLAHATQNPAPHLKLSRPAATSGRRNLTGPARHRRWWLDYCRDLFSVRKCSRAQPAR